MEQPNLSVIKEISENDSDFENSILDILKSEFPKDVSLFTKHFETKNYCEASNDVHKIKHKISLLGLEEGLKIATEFETALKAGDTKLHQDFIEILDKIHVYLY